MLTRLSTPTLFLKHDKYIALPAQEEFGSNITAQQSEQRNDGYSSYSRDTDSNSDRRKGGLCRVS